MANTKRVAVLRKLGEFVWTPIKISKETRSFYDRYEAEMRKGSCRGYRVERMPYHSTNVKACFYKSDDGLLMVESEQEISLSDHPMLKEIMGYKFFPISSWARSIPRGISWYRIGELVEIHEIEN